MKTDVTIVGAGLAGLIASIQLSHIGYNVVCIDYEGEKGKKNDLRSTALLLPSINLLKAFGVWEQIKINACPMQSMRIRDLSDEKNITEVKFHAQEIAEEEFGYNVQNQTLYNNLVTFLKQSKNITVIHNDKFMNVRTRTNATFTELKSGLRIQSKLLIGADGRNSSVREKLEIHTKTKTYNQHALAFKVKHEKSHENISTEIYKSGGPFTIVPLAEPKQSAIIWMDNTSKIRNIAKLDSTQFNSAITIRSGNCLGALSRISELTSWPVISQITKNTVKERCVLIAEAAHVLPPIGAQGLNMSIQDIRALANIIEGEEDPGSMELLRKYEKTRIRDSKLRTKLIHGLNLSSISNKFHAQKARSMAIQLIASSPKLRSFLIEKGLG